MSLSDGEIENKKCLSNYSKDDSDLLIQKCNKRSNILNQYEK